jgi:hypothetical protein
MSATDEQPLLRGSRRVLMLSTVVMAAAAAAVLALGTQDARLLRLGLVAALWAALLGAFVTAQVRHETSACTEQSDQLRTHYQLELEREVAAQREHTLTVERELREQAELLQRREIMELRTELAAMRASLEQLLAEFTRLLPPPAHPRKFDDGRVQAAAAVTAGATVKAVQRGLTGPEFRFGPGRPQTPTEDSAASRVGPEFSNGTTSHGGLSNGQSRHGVPNREWSGSNGNGPHRNGSRNNGGDARQTATAAAQRTVNDLLAAHGNASVSRRRHSQEDPPPA